jgi:hypothetical protein
MRNRRFASLVTAAVLATASASAFAQYPPGYGGYGWGGWGSTPGGDIARGLGTYAAGAGAYNLNTAQAYAINSDTVMRWNEAAWEMQHSINQAYYRRQVQRRIDIDKAQAAIYSRLKDNPDEHDIEDGDALNVQLDILVNPKVYMSTIGMLRTPISRAMIREIPFEYASEGYTFSLNQMTEEDGWPPALRESIYAPYRKKVHDAMAAAVEEDVKGMLTPPTIKKASDAVTELRKRFEKEVPPESPDYLPARDFMKGLAGLVRMLHSPEMEEAIAGLEKAPNTTVGDLLGFMHAYNLRFAPAKTRRQVQIYQEIYPVLANAPKSLPDKVADSVSQVAASTVNRVKGAVGSTEKALGSAASSFFKAMDWRHFDKQ